MNNCICDLEDDTKRIDWEGCDNEVSSVPQTAERWGISSRRIQVLCGENRIPGAVKIGNRWAIPDDEPKPADARIKSGKYIKGRRENGMAEHSF